MPIRCRTIIEVLGKPKEHVEASLKEYISKLKTEDGIMVLKQEVTPAEQQEKDKLWSSFAEIELIVKGLTRFISFCVNYMPSSVEIIKPEEFSLKNNEVTSFLNELQSKLHAVDMVAKTLHLENDFLKRNISSLVKNSILLSLRVSKLTRDGLSKTTGINGNELDLFLVSLSKEKKIKKEGDIYSLVVKP